MTAKNTGDAAPRLLSGGNPQIPKGEGDGPGQVFRCDLTARLQDAFEQPIEIAADADGTEIGPHTSAPSLVAVAVGAEGEGGVVKDSRPRREIGFAGHGIEELFPGGGVGGGRTVLKEHCGGEEGGEARPEGEEEERAEPARARPAPHRRGGGSARRGRLTD